MGIENGTPIRVQSQSAYAGGGLVEGVRRYRIYATRCAAIG
jgi:hypothetical protein